MVELLDILKVLHGDGLLYTLPKLPTGTLITVNLDSDDFGDGQYCKVVKNGLSYRMYNMTKFYNTGIKEVILLSMIEVYDLLTTGDLDKYKNHKKFEGMDIHDYINTDSKLMEKIDCAVHMYMSNKQYLDMYIFDNMNISYYQLNNMVIRIPSFIDRVDDIENFFTELNDGVRPSISIKI